MYFLQIPLGKTVYSGKIEKSMLKLQLKVLKSKIFGLGSKETHYHSPLDKPMLTNVENHPNAFWVFFKMTAHFQALSFIQDGDHARLLHPENMMSTVSDEDCNRGLPDLLRYEAQVRHPCCCCPCSQFLNTFCLDVLRREV